ncbi:hypothetical protein M9H77_25548 [Catharanthus roseus]|uniref:Uncharacterized protein n=1 Tax=Catharanthus roseus TaxID=4058 RepID=A0ACC0A785_CATRO|nr:hypothetical protein M9H77_25548 [Catharanthus roseus]
MHFGFVNFGEANELRCLFTKCKNKKYLVEYDVKLHLYKHEILPETAHCESSWDYQLNIGESSDKSNVERNTYREDILNAASLDLELDAMYCNYEETPNHEAQRKESARNSQCDLEKKFEIDIRKMNNIEDENEKKEDEDEWESNDEKEEEED